jgi:RNA polymerase sigma-70 factor (sigma-E family)
VQTFEDFLAARLEWLARFSRTLCGDRHLAEDVLQEVLLRAHRQWDRIGAADSPNAYVRTMIVHEYLAWRRKWGRQTPVAEVIAVDSTGDPSDTHATRDELIALMRTLPRQQRAAVVLRYYSDLDDHAIATILGCTPGTVRGYLSRALATLRVELTDRAPTPAEKGSIP